MCDSIILAVKIDINSNMVSVSIKARPLKARRVRQSLSTLRKTTQVSVSLMNNRPQFRPHAFPPPTSDSEREEITTKELLSETRKSTSS